MVKTDVFEMAFGTDSYENEADMWNDIRDFLRIMTKNDYVGVIEEEDFGVYVVRYGYKDAELGCSHPEWLDGEEYELFQDALRAKKEGVSE